MFNKQKIFFFTISYMINVYCKIFSLLVLAKQLGIIQKRFCCFQLTFTAITICINCTLLKTYIFANKSNCTISESSVTKERVWSGEKRFVNCACARTFPAPLRDTFNGFLKQVKHIQTTREKNHQKFRLKRLK